MYQSNVAYPGYTTSQGSAMGTPTMGIPVGPNTSILQQGYPAPVILPSPPEGTWGIGIEEFQRKYNVSPKWTPYLQPLKDYVTVIVCDDSGSMRMLADPDVGDNMTRWAELKMIMNVVVEAHAAVGTVCDVYFINRGAYRNVSSFAQLSGAFTYPPSGGTNLLRVLQQVAADHCNPDLIERNVIIHIFTDGHPTNDQGREDFPAFANWLRRRPCIDKTFFSIILCTDDEYIDQLYRQLEYNPGMNLGIRGVDCTEDYRGELRDVRRTRGWNYPFSFGDYVVKTIAGAIDPSIHLIDLPAQPDCCAIS